MSEINTTKNKDMFLVDPRNIIIEDGFNTRRQYTEIEELAASIKENGIKIPLRGYKKGEKYVLTDGHRRMKAVQLLSDNGTTIERVPFISEKIISMEARTIEILISNSGVPLTPLELSDTYKRLISYGLTDREIASKTGKSLQHVKETLDLSVITKATAELIADKSVSANSVKKLLKSNTPEEVEQKVKEAVSGPKKKQRQVAVNLNKKLTKEYLDEMKAVSEIDSVSELIKNQISDTAVKKVEYEVDQNTVTSRSSDISTDNSAVKQIYVFNYGQYKGERPKGKEPQMTLITPPGFTILSDTHTRIVKKKRKDGTEVHFLY